MNEPYPAPESRMPGPDTDVLPPSDRTLVDEIEPSTPAPTMGDRYPPPTFPPTSVIGEPWPGPGNRSRPAPDRVWPHLIWEFLLAVAVAVAFFLVDRENPALFSGESGDVFWFQLGLMAILAVAFALSLRVGVPNLAVAASALAAAALARWLVADHDWSWAAATVTVLGIGLAVGLLLGLFVALLQVPAWAATLGVAVLFTGLWMRLRREIPLGRGDEPPDISDVGIWIFILAVVVSVVGSALWTVHAIRNSLTIRQDRDPAARPSIGGVLGAVLALFASTVLATVAGVLIAFRQGASADGIGWDSVEFELIWGYLPLAAVLVGGVSAFGRRGGVFGTMLAVTLLFLLPYKPFFNLTMLEQVGYLVGGAFLVGLIITRLVEVISPRRTSLR